MLLTAARVKDKARALGFDLCGVAPAQAFPELSFLRGWLDKGYAGNMTYLHRSAKKRADVRVVVPGARSVIVTGTLYNTNRPYSTDQAGRPGEGVVARYAWGDDYHDVLQARLDALVAWMHEESPDAFDARAYVDTGPVQERVFAQHAGLGWIGKNTCLINAEVGSWLFLAEVICTLPLEPGTEGLEQCGSCTRCLDACPTGALVEPGVLDATRCVSYLTIELKRKIPDAQRPGLGARIYGCDVCQEVCPYNQAPLTSVDPAWQPRAGLDQPGLVELWRRSDDDLVKLTFGSAMTRAGLTGLRRNLAVAMGNSGDASAAEALASPVEDAPSTRDPMVLEHVGWALRRLATS